MTLEDFKDVYKDKTPVEKLKLMQVQHYYWRNDMKDRIDANWRGNFEEAQYYARECDAMRDRVVWLHEEISKALEHPDTKLLTADEIQHLQDRETVCVEQLISREGEPHGYVTGCGWGVMCNRDNSPENGLLVSMLGTFFPNTITKIPYTAMYSREDGSGIYYVQFRFWTDRPTVEQSEEVPWDD